jgi:quercetin dioxygenase-like cupin family protein
MSVFHHIASNPRLPIWEGVRAQAVEGQRITLALVELDPNILLPEHVHENEQVGTIVRGTMAFTIGGETRELGPGAAWTILSGVPHSVQVGPEGCTVIESFSPIRSDWHSVQPLEDEALR